MAGEQLFFVGVKAVIRNGEGKVLLLQADVSTHRKNTEVYWDLPGGRIEEGQDILETLAREIEEETGITNFKNPRLLTTMVSNHRIPVNGSGEAGLVLIIYTVQVAENVAVRLSGEHTAYDWVDPAAALQRLKDKYPEDLPL